MSQSFFVISLDFELHWGRFDKTSYLGRLGYYERAREAVPRLLDLFAEFGISATWATVGMLLANDREEWRIYQPDVPPLFKSEGYSAYRWYEKHEVPDSILFAPDLAKCIHSYPGQEIGCHTHAHYYTGAAGACEASFRADLQAARRIAKEKLGMDMRSLVFPRNQYNDEVLRISGEEGFSMVRTNPYDWYWQNPQDHEFSKRLFRTGDSILPLSNKTSYPRAMLHVPKPPLPVQVPASRFFRPFQSKALWVNRLKLKRIFQEMNLAAAEGEVYHMWWHPHNHGHHLESSLAEVRQVLSHYQQLHEKTGMQSINMADLGAIVYSV
ncbi:hypothetical protein ADIS_3170 [Lunatimonas lonarensis]|uniref:NodB homology domain-containing protein n=1 Tax=Lunatimonas lonarensis TaxID=1232681 RepID=R7ZPN0_9BACT|nr:polysaccharide deacetylase family protein [Lunatimonas lonarensis]EON76042.1 hypothetical protein ADIS_3170 [Lunatimonas lonarensis]